MRGVLWVAVGLGAVHGANAGSVSFRGSLAAPASVALERFTIAAPSYVSVQSFGYGGGYDAAGAAIQPGGFEPYLTLFTGSGPNATFAASSYGITGVCPPANAVPQCADPGFMSLFAAGTYTLAISDFSNISYAENSGAGTLADGFTGFTYSDFTDGFGNLRSGAYEVEIASPALVDEPSTGLGLGILSGVIALTRLSSRSRQGDVK